jgi:hypothetical protein
MAGKALASFQDFIKATNENKFTSPTDIINDYVNRTYALADASRGREMNEIVQDGASITDRNQLAAGTQFEFYDPNQTFAPYDEDTLNKTQAPWRFAKDCFVWTEHELDLNQGKDRYVEWVDLAKSKRQACGISTLNGIEAAIWATPNSATMESLTVTGGRPYSIPALISENGIQPSGWTTTILQTDPTANNNRWVNQVANYAYAAIDTTLISAMESMWRQVKFESPETKDEYFRETKFRKMRIYTNLDGWKTWVRLTRMSNDRNFPTNDLGYATNDPVMGGVPIKWIEALETYGYALGQPRFFWVNYEYLFPVWNSKRYMKEIEPLRSPVQPFTWVVYYDTWYNWYCRSRYRQGIVVPN